MLLARIEGALLSKAYKLRFQVSVFRFQDFATRIPDTRNPKPETHINCQHGCGLQGPLSPSIVSKKAWYLVEGGRLTTQSKIIIWKTISATNLPSAPYPEPAQLHPHFAR